MSPSVTGIGTFKSSVLEVSRSMGVECLVVPQGAQMGLGDAGRGRVQILKFFQFNSIVPSVVEISRESLPGDPTPRPARVVMG